MANLSNTRFKKTDRASSQEFTFDSDMLKMLLAIDEKKTLREVAQEVKMGQAAFKDTFVKLVKLRLIEQVGDQETCVEESFINFMREALIQLIGPLGEVLVDDTADEMGMTASSIPVSGLADFVAAVAKEIPGDKQSNEFKKRMLKEMREQGL